MAIKRRIVLSLLANTGVCYRMGAAPTVLTVAAASDLAPMEKALREGFGGAVRFSFGSSGSLLRQIENGAPFDLYLAANEQYVQEGVAKSVLLAPAKVYGTGRIALWSRSGAIKRLEQLRDRGVLHVAIANPAYAPYGAAARQALEKAGLWNELRARIVLGENVRQTMQYAESGNADAAIVSWTLTKHRGGVLLPDTLHAPIRQAGAVVRGSARQQDAQRFIEWLVSPPGKAVLQAHGLD